MDENKCKTHEIHEYRLTQLETDMNNMGKKYDIVLFGEKGDNGVMGAMSSFRSELKINRLFMSGIIAMCIGIIGLLIKLVFFPIKNYQPSMKTSNIFNERIIK